MSLVCNVTSLLSPVAVGLWFSFIRELTFIAFVFIAERREGRSRAG